MSTQVAESEKNIAPVGFYENRCFDERSFSIRFNVIQSVLREVHLSRLLTSIWVFVQRYEMISRGDVVEHEGSVIHGIRLQ